MVFPMVFPFNFIRKKYISRIRKQAVDSFKTLDVLQGRQRFIGTESQLIARLSDGIQKDREKIYNSTFFYNSIFLQNFLAKTKKGQWFVYGVYICKGHIVEVDVRPMTDEDAATFLRYDLSLYEQHFGELEIA